MLNPRHRSSVGFTCQGARAENVSVSLLEHFYWNKDPGPRIQSSELDALNYFK